MKKLIALFVSLLLSVAPSLAAPTNFHCDVSLLDILVYGDGTVNVRHSGRNDYTHICNLTSERLGVQPITCATWTAMLLAIKKRGANARFYYNAEGSCATLPVYSGAPAPVYIGEVS